MRGHSFIVQGNCSKNFSSCWNFFVAMTGLKFYFGLVLLINSFHGLRIAYKLSNPRLFSHRLFSTTATPVSSTTVSTDYNADSITVLEGLEPVRKRPGMYIGSTGPKGLHHLVFEVVDNSVDESLAGHCTEISVSLLEDGSVEISDNGRGIPCGIHPTTGKSTLETVLCVLHAGGKFGGDESGYKVSGGLHGVGISVVNALSEKLVVEVNRDGKSHAMTFAEGIPQTGLIVQTAENPKARGTKVVFKPDPKIFKTTLDFEFDKLATRLDELAYLNPGLTIRLIDKRSKAARKQSVLSAAGLDDDNVGSSSSSSSSASASSSKVKKGGFKSKGKSLIKSEDSEESLQQTAIVTEASIDRSDTSGDSMAPRVEVYRHDGGLVEMVKELCKDKTNLHPEMDVISLTEERKGVSVSIALRWSSDQYTESLVGFANNIRTSDGGSHLDGLKSAITKTVNALARKNGKIKEGAANVPGEFIREGLTGVVSVKVPEPEFEGQTKTRLGNPEIRQLVDSVSTDALTTIFEWNGSVLNSIAQKALEAQNAALAAKAARDMVRRKTLLTSTVLPGKLADCSSRMPAECEIYVVEGDSAAGSAKQGRDRRTQAILPLRGKILNIERASNDKIYQNTELQALISALGLGIRGIEFDPEQLRYHKIIIMTGSTPFKHEQ